MWEAELSFDVILNSMQEPYLKAQRIDTIVAETLPDIVSMTSHYLSLPDYRLVGIEGHRLYLKCGGINIRMTLYHEFFRERGPEIQAAMKALQQLLMSSGARPV